MPPKKSTRSVNPTISIPARPPSPPRPRSLDVPQSRHIPRNLTHPCSSQTIPDSLWAGSDVQLGAGVVIIQPETEKMVVLSEKWVEEVGTGKKVLRKKGRDVEVDGGGVDKDDRDGRRRTKAGKKRKGRHQLPNRQDASGQGSIQVGHQPQHQRGNPTYTSTPMQNGSISNTEGTSASTSSPNNRVQYTQPNRGSISSWFPGTNSSSGSGSRTAESFSRGFSDLSSRAARWMTPGSQAPSTSTPNGPSSGSSRHTNPSSYTSAMATSSSRPHAREAHRPISESQNTPDRMQGLNYVWQGIGPSAAGDKRRATGSGLRPSPASPASPILHTEFPKDEYTDEHEEVEYERWFLPKGRKDLGESLEDAAVREGYEESGYRISLFPLPIPTNALSPPPSPSLAKPADISAPDDSNTNPATPTFSTPSSSSTPTPTPLALTPYSSHDRYSTEPIFVSTHHMPPNQRRANGVEYLTFYYLARLPLGAVREEGTRMEDEEEYESHLVGFDEAMDKLKGEQRIVAGVGWDIWREAVDRERREREKEMNRGERRLRGRRWWEGRGGRGGTTASNSGGERLGEETTLTSMLLE